MQAIHPGHDPLYPIYQLWAGCVHSRGPELEHDHSSLLAPITDNTIAVYLYTAVLCACLVSGCHRPVSLCDITVHDTENLTFPRNSVVVPRGTTRIFRTGAAELLRGHRGFSGRAGADLPRRRAQIFRADSV